MRLTRSGRRVLQVLAEGGELWCCLNDVDTMMRTGAVFSEALRLRVFKRLPSGQMEFAFHVRNKTADALAISGLIAPNERVGGDRPYFITDEGRAALSSPPSARAPLPLSAARDAPNPCRPDRPGQAGGGGR